MSRTIHIEVEGCYSCPFLLETNDDTIMDDILPFECYHPDGHFLVKDKEAQTFPFKCPLLQ